jgi:hypothetical protein
MLATRIRQKDGIFYFVSFKAKDILHRVRFTSRFYFEGETIEADADADDPIAKFIGKVEKSEKAFQRLLSRKKVRERARSFSLRIFAPGRIGRMSSLRII